MAMADGNSPSIQAVSAPAARRLTMRAGSALRAISAPLTPSPVPISRLPTHQQILAVRGGALRDSLRKMQAGRGVQSAEIQRRRRSERVCNVTTLIEVLLRSTCLKTGRIGRPMKSGSLPGQSKWRNPTVQELGKWAFGQLVKNERAEDRTWRALAQLVEAGFLSVEKTPPAVEGGQFKGRASIKKWTSAGLKWLGIKLTEGTKKRPSNLAPAGVSGQSQPAADRQKGGPVRAAQAALQALKTAGQGRAEPAPRPPEPPPEPARSGVVTEVGKAHIDALKKQLGLDF